MNGKYWDRAWSLVDGCTPVSPGCEHCWSKAMAERFHRWPEKVTPRWDRLEIPRKVKKPTVWAVWNDLFHEDVPADLIHRALYVMMNCPQHTFLILTKRAKRMYEWFNPPYPPKTVRIWKWPLDNLWLGVTAENQELANSRIPELLKIPAAKRFVSIEPMLGPVDLVEYLSPVNGDDVGINIENNPYNPWIDGIDWIICGGETGPKARPMHPDWVRLVRDDCQAAGVPFWFKGWGEWSSGQSNDLTLDGKTGYFEREGLFFESKYIPREVQSMIRVGHKTAGRLLDGKEWNERPEKR